MACYSNQRVTICKPDMVRRVIGRTRKWCFGCRKRLIHFKVLHTEILRFTKGGELLNGWQEPFITLECRRCKRDLTDFPSGF